MLERVHTWATLAFGDLPPGRESLGSGVSGSGVARQAFALSSLLPLEDYGLTD